MIKQGSKVSINYTLTVDGEVVDTSEDRGPLEFEHGSGQIIPGLEEEMVGMKLGDKKQVKVEPEKAYGPRQDEAVQKVPLTAFQESKDLKVGDIVKGQVEEKEFQAIIMELSDTEVTLDMNHPLAGKTLNFDIEIVSVE